MTRRFITSYPIFDNVDISTAQESAISNILNLDNIGIMINVTDVSANDGEFSIEVSNDKEVWATLPFTDPLSGDQVFSIGLEDADEVIALSLNQVCFSWIKLVFTPNTSTDGVCSATLTAKQL